MAQENEATAQEGGKPGERWLGREPWIYRPEMWREAKKIEVAASVKS